LREGLFTQTGPKVRRLEAYLRRRAATPSAERGALDAAAVPRLVRKRGILYTDTADFTVRTQKHGIQHFLMAFDRVVAVLRAVVRSRGGSVVKVEADSFLVSFADARLACVAVQAVDRALHKLNREVPESERFHFSYGIGYGDVVEVEGDAFGLELNLASKLGEDLAYPGEALLTPSAVLNLAPRERRRLVPHRPMAFKGIKVPVKRLPLKRRAGRGRGSR
jgi:class 3 adenylate cyclase